MKNMIDVDPNFRIDTSIDKENITFYDIQQAPFSVHGLFYENGLFRRLPEAVAKSVSVNVAELHTNPAGGRVRFKTDSTRIAIHAEMPMIQTSAFNYMGNNGFDMYVKHDGEERFEKSFVPPVDMVSGYESMHTFSTAKLREITINFPIRGRVSELLIGIDKDAKLYPAEPYSGEKPIVYYGSSITQGGCASRPGNTYEAMVSRRLNRDYINLGFAGSARAEPEIADYIKDLEMEIFVYDYDYNSKTIPYLEETHERMFRTVREANPQLPILIMSRPKYHLTGANITRRDIIKRTYDNAKAAGDENVYFLDGPALMALAKYDATVDGTHPNDLGFYSMSQAVGDVLETILEKI